MRKSLKKGIVIGMAVIMMTGLAACTSKTESVDYCGTYTGEKHIDAMNCDIEIRITLNEDGTYSYYRAPMLIELEGSAEMPELTEEGTYVVEDEEIFFTGEELGEYEATLQVTEETASMEGSLPTGGPTTDMILEREAK